jgi:carbonic anhydrase/acetyltransferase-like protein (isoleucine patch superfamily)
MSNINPYNIDGTFPVAGQDNSSQGFRDNFTNIKNNFLFAQNELNDLQAKVLVTSALTGQSVNNDMAGTKLTRPQLDAWTQTLFDNGNVSTSAVLDFNVANFQKITTSGSISLSFINWPTTTGINANGYGVMRIWINVSDPSHTVTFPSSVSIGISQLAGYAGNGVLTFSSAGDYVFDISSIDSGTTYLIFDLTRDRNTVNDNISVSGNATIAGQALIGAGASITGNASITGIATIGGAATIGGNATITGHASIGAGANITGAASITSDASIGGNATVSGTATITGRATIGGTASIGGNTTINGGLTTNGGRVDQAIFLYVLGNTSLPSVNTIVANAAISTIVIDSYQSSAIANVVIQLPANPVDRQTIKITSVAPITQPTGSPSITGANVYDPAGHQVKWVPTGTFSSGNTAVNLTYFAASSTWYRS